MVYAPTDASKKIEVAEAVPPPPPGIPWWFWALLGVSAGVLALTGVVAFAEYVKEEKKKKPVKWVPPRAYVERWRPVG